MTTPPTRWGWRPILLLALIGSPLQGQDVSITPYVSAGPGSNGLSASGGLRLEVGRVWGGYVRVAARGVTNACETSLPPRCNYPEGAAREYAAGITHTSSLDERWVARGGVGGGVLSWQDEGDRFVELIGELRRALSEDLALVVGLHGILAPGVGRERSGTRTIVSEKHVLFPNAVVGFAVRFD